MATIQTSFSVVYIEEDKHTNHRFLDGTVAHEPISHSKEGVTLPGKLTNFEIASLVNLVVLQSDKPVNIKIGDTTANELTNVKVFAYDGDTTTIFATNPGVDKAEIKMATAKYS